MTRNADILLVVPILPRPRERFYVPDHELPLGICCLGAWLKKAGHEARLIDMSVEPAGSGLAQLAKGMEPAIVGFTGYTPFMDDVARIAAEAKTLWPRATTVLGGYHASALPERTLREIPSIDLLIAGEGETPLLELAERIGNGKSAEDVAGVWRRREDGSISGNAPPKPMDVDALPFPARDMLPIERYSVNSVNAMDTPSTGIIAGRGCNHRCAYCSQSVWRGLRLRSPENIVAEMRDCRERFGMKGFRFYDDNLTASREHCAAFCERLLNEMKKYSWNCFSRVDSVDEELLRQMRKAGCLQIKYGVETGTERVSKMLRKGTRFEQNEAAVRATKRAGIECQITLMIGLPDETEAEARETIRYALRLAPDLISINHFKPLPGSPLYRQLLDEDRLDAAPWSEYSVKSMRPVVKGTLPERDIQQLMREGYTRFYMRPGYILGRLRWIARRPWRELKRYAVGFYTLTAGTPKAAG